VAVAVAASSVSPYGRDSYDVQHTIIPSYWN
jgi:hypothetical protein